MITEGNYQKKMESIQKDFIAEKYSTWNEILNWMDLTVDWKWEKKGLVNLKTNNQKQKQIVSDLWNNIKWSKRNIIGVQEGENFFFFFFLDRGEFFLSPLPNAYVLTKLFWSKLKILISCPKYLCAPLRKHLRWFSCTIIVTLLNRRKQKEWGKKLKK